MDRQLAGIEFQKRVKEARGWDASVFSRTDDKFINYPAHMSDGNLPFYSGYIGGSAPWDAAGFSGFVNTGTDRIDRLGGQRFRRVYMDGKKFVYGFWPEMTEKELPGKAYNEVGIREVFANGPFQVHSEYIGDYDELFSEAVKNGILEAPESDMERLAICFLDGQDIINELIEVPLAYRKRYGTFRNGDVTAVIEQTECSIRISMMHNGKCKLQYPENEVLLASASSYDKSDASRVDFGTLFGRMNEDPELFYSAGGISDVLGNLRVKRMGGSKYNSDSCVMLGEVIHHVYGDSPAKLVFPVNYVNSSQMGRGPEAT